MNNLIRKNGRPKMPRKNELRYCNVALLPEDHAKLKQLAEIDQRSMTRQLSVIIRKDFTKLGEAENAQ